MSINQKKQLQLPKIRNINETTQNCKLHTFCNQSYEFNDQSEIVRKLHLPHSVFNGDELPTPTADRSPKKQKNNNISVEDITEEALDDWIAQSTNRPIVSFLDPYKKFKAPDSLIQKLKKRYAKYLSTIDQDDEKKLLYFDDRRDGKKHPHYMMPTRQPKETKKEVIFNFNLLYPKTLSGTNINQREDFAYNEYKQRNRISTTHQNQFLPDINNQHNKHENQHYFSENRKQKNYKNQKQNQTEQENDPTVMYISEHQRQDEDNSSNNNNNQFQFAPEKLINYKLKPVQLPPNPQKQHEQQQQKQETQHIKNMKRSNTLQESPIKVNLQNIQQGQKKQTQNATLQLLQQQEGEDYDELSKQVLDLLQYGNEKPSKNENQDVINLNIHVDLIIEQQYIDKEKSQMKDVEFSYWRSQRRMQKFLFMEAIQCCKETLTLDRKNFNTIYNLANLYERTKRFELASKWFSMASQIKPQDNNIFYGLSISLFKLGKVSQAIVYIENIVEDLLKMTKFEQCRNPKKGAIYLRALCNRQMGIQAQSSIDYKNFITLCTPQNFVLLRNLMFSIVFKGKRGLEVQMSQMVISDFITVITQITISTQYINPLSQFRAKKESFIKRLTQIPFFKRFSEEECSAIYEKGELANYDEDDIVYTDPEFVEVITAGHLVVYDHRQNYNLPVIISYYASGDMIGLPSKDNGISSCQDIWFQVTSSKLEVLRFPTKIFEQFWKLQDKNQKKKEIVDFIRKLEIFEGVSEIGLYKLSYESFETQQFRTGEIIFSNTDYQEKKQITLKKLEDIKKQKKNQNGNLPKYEKPKLKGFYLIKSGQAELVTTTGWIDHILNPGDFIGENLLFETESISQLGKIKTRNDQCTCLHLPKQFFHELNKLDKEIMQRNILKSSKYAQITTLIKDFEEKKALKKVI